MFDGMTSVTGVIFALLSRGETAIILAAVGLAIASAIGMGAGEWLSDSSGPGSLRRAAVMAGATVIGTAVLVVPFLLLPKTPALIVAGFLAVLLGAVIGHARRKGVRGYVVTYGILVTAASVTVLVSLLIPASAGG